MKRPQLGKTSATHLKPGQTPNPSGSAHQILPLLLQLLLYITLQENAAKN